MHLHLTSDRLLCHNVAGLIFDSTYSGKAFHALREDIRRDSAHWKGRKVILCCASDRVQTALPGQTAEIFATN